MQTALPVLAVAVLVGAAIALLVDLYSHAAGSVFGTEGKLSVSAFWTAYQFAVGQGAERPNAAVGIFLNCNLKGIAIRYVAGCGAYRRVDGAAISNGYAQCAVGRCFILVGILLDIFDDRIFLLQFLFTCICIYAIGNVDID